MPNAVVYSPFTGQNWGQANYCYIAGNPVHQPGIFCCPIDIGGGSQNTPLNFYGSNVLSIRTTRFSGFCFTPPPAPYNDGVIVELYSQFNLGGCFFGKVFYGHVQNRIADGTYNNPNGLTVGQLAGNCNCACTKGIHVHMTRNGGSSPSYSCGVTLNQGVAVVFQYSVTGC